MALITGDCTGSAILTNNQFFNLVSRSRLTEADKTKAISENLSAMFDYPQQCEALRQRWANRINKLEDEAHEIETMRQLAALNDGLKSEAPPSTSTTPPPAVTKTKANTGMASQEKPLSPREKDNLHRIIAALLELAKTPRQNKNNDAGVIAEIIEKHTGKDGLSTRNLQAVFAQAKRILKAD